MKEKLKAIVAHLTRLVKTPTFNICIGVFVVVTSFLDIKEDITKISKEHFTLFIGILMIIDSVHSLLGGVQKVFIVETNTKIEIFVIYIKRMMHSAIYYIIIGLIIVITSAYDIYEDFLKMKKEHLTLLLGIIYIFIALKKAYEGGEKAFKGVEREIPEIEKMES